MFVQNNSLTAFKTFFFERLQVIYEEGEVKQLFYLTFFYLKGWDKITLRLNEKTLLSESELFQLRTVVKRLAQSEPIQHIFGSTHFYGIDIIVNKHVLIPRQETEELVDLIIQRNQGRPIRLLDIGTGSGCIPIAVGINLPNAKMYAIDVCAEALKVAAKNAKENNVNIELHQADVLKVDDLSNVITESVDVIVSNPPYITAQEKEQMHKNVLNFDPALALFVANETPLVFYEKITELAAQKLAKGGQLYFEINEQFGAETLELVKKYPFCEVELLQDINGKDRIIKALKQ